MALSDYVNTFGQFIKSKNNGHRVHKIAIDAGFTCPNRDGTKGRGGCTFCNNSSFSPNGRDPDPVLQQIDSGRKVIYKRTRAKKFMAYFQAYTNTYADINDLKKMYDTALAEPDVIGLSIGTRPDCLPTAVLDLLAHYREEGHEIWLELGLQSSFDKTLQRVNRGHDFQEYLQAIKKTHARNIPVCTHLIIGLPGESNVHTGITHARVLDAGVAGLKLHPLHVVKGTQLANEWRRGEYEPITLEDYISTVADIIENTPEDIVFHRLTGTVSENLLLTPHWCSKKWIVLNGIEQELVRRNTSQGHTYRTELSRP